jgi:hypothetical protein
MSDGTPSHCGSGEGGCCERAQEDPSARRCCEGGAQFERTGSSDRASALPPAEPVFHDAVIFARSIDRFDGARDPVPRAEPLYTLHASLLI